jgi:hypothetical protein
MIHPRFQKLLEMQQQKQAAECRYINRAMRAEKMKIRIKDQVFRDDIKGRVTKPSKGLDDPQFVYTPAFKTDLAATFRRERERLEAERRA